jgi:hypothetical protein
MVRTGSLTIGLALALAVAAASADAQVRPRAERQQTEAALERRAELEQRVRERFLAQVNERLGLDAAQRARLETVLRQGAEERRALALESRQLRVELVRAVADTASPFVRYQQLLDRMSDLRTREQALERRETAALAEFLDTRQQAQFLVLRMHLNERVRGMGMGPGPGPAAPGAGRPPRH